MRCLAFACCILKSTLGCRLLFASTSLINSPSLVARVKSTLFYVDSKSNYRLSRLVRILDIMDGEFSGAEDVLRFLEGGR